MAIKREVYSIDSHGAGMISRMLMGPFIWPKCKTMAEKRDYFIKNYDSVRRAVMLEPRGHDNMFGSVLCEPCDPRADVGVIFIHTGGILNMCGHGTIAMCTGLTECGIVNIAGKEYVDIKIDTPAGLVSATCHMVGDKCESVSFINVPSFSYQKGLKMDLPGYGEIRFDLSFGGSFFAAVPTDQLGLVIDVRNAKILSNTAMEIKKLINDQLPVQHPEKPINTVDLISLYQFDKEKRFLKSCVVFGLGQIDRSPCGTSTCAMTALLYDKGLIGMDEEIISESIMGTQFRVRAVEKVPDYYGYNAIVPRITGSGYVIGTNRFVIDFQDPFYDGFSLQPFEQD